MKQIKSLMLKDLLQLKSYWKSILVFILVFVITSIANKSGNLINMMGFMISFGFAMFSIANFSYDEYNHAERYILTLPLKRNDIIASRYLFVLSSLLFSVVLGILISFGLTYFLNFTNMVEIEFSFVETASICLGAAGAMSLFTMVQMPLLYKFGAEKGRFLIFIPIATIVFVGGYLFTSVNGSQLLNQVLGLGEVTLTIIVIGLLLVCYGVSYLISCKIYQKKEF